jgi:hypothetical protein
MDKNIYVKSNNTEYKDLKQNKKIIVSKPNKITFDYGYNKIKLYKQVSSIKKHKKTKKQYSSDYNKTKLCNKCGKANYMLNTHLLEHINDNELCSCSNHTDNEYDISNHTDNEYDRSNHTKKIHYCSDHTDKSYDESYGESYDVTSVNTPTCVYKYNCSDEYDSHNHCEIENNVHPKQIQMIKLIPKVELEQDNMVTQINLVSTHNKFIINHFMVNLQKIINTISLFIASLTELQTETIKHLHEKLINLYDFDENFTLDTPIIISFIMALNNYGKYIMDIENYDNIEDIIINLNKINCNQNDILNIVLLYQK